MQSTGLVTLNRIGIAIAAAAANLACIGPGSAWASPQWRLSLQRLPAMGSGLRSRCSRRRNRQ